MKPIVIFIDEIKNGKISLTKEELEKMIEQAYEQGHTDGFNEGKNYFTINPIRPLDVPNTPINPSPWSTPIVYCNDITTSHTNQAGGQTESGLGAKVTTLLNNNTSIYKDKE